MLILARRCIIKQCGCFEAFRKQKWISCGIAHEEKKKKKIKTWSKCGVLLCQNAFVSGLSNLFGFFIFLYPVFTLVWQYCII